MNSETISENGIAGEKSLRLLRPSLVVLCGPAACGKSTFAERHFRPTQIISSDWARARVSDDDRDQRYNAQAFALVHFLIEQRLTVNRLCVVDSTALTTQARKDLLDLAKKRQVPITLIFFNVPLETCIERDEKRERSVGRAVLERQYQAFEQSKASIRQEGFDQVVEFQDGDLEKVRIEVLFRPVGRPVQRPQQPNAVAPRRFDPAKPSRPISPGIQPEAARGPAGASASVSAPKAATPRPTEGPAPVASKQPPPAVHPPASPANSSKPSSPAPSAASSQAARPVPSPPVPSGTQTSGGS